MYLLYEERRSNVQTVEESGKIFSVYDGTMTSKPDEIHEIIIKNKFQKDIVLKNVSAKWIKDSKEEILGNINAQFKSGKLSAIVGPVGSGKVRTIM